MLRGMEIVKVEFKSSWIFDASGLNGFSVSRLISGCREKFKQEVSVSEQSLTAVVFEIGDSVDSAEADRLIQEVVRGIVCGRQDWREICTIIVEGRGAPNSNDNGVQESNDSSGLLESLQQLLAETTDRSSSISVDSDELSPAPDSFPCAPEVLPVPIDVSTGEPVKSGASEAVSSHVESILGDVEHLVAAAEFKALCGEIKRKASFIRSRGTSRAFLSTTLLFSIASGGGLNTSLGLIKDLLVEEGIFSEEAFVKEVVLPDPGKEDAAERLNNFLGSIEHSVEKPGVLCIDMGKWLNRTTDPLFKNFLLWLFRHSGSCLVVLRTSYLERDLLKQICLDISDILSVRPIVFDPFDPIDLRELANRVLSGYGFSMSEDAWRIFDRRMELEKRDGCFYGIHTVNKVANELIRCTESDEAIVEGGSSLITAETIGCLVADEEVESSGGFDRFDALIGMEPIKAQVMEVVNQIIVAKNNPAISRPSMHMRFVGNPGTGKTTVARILGEVLRESGVLCIGRFHEHKARDLCGRYVGETAPKTTAICQQAYGSILFLDEAYALYRGDGNDRDYGREAIDALITEMENNSDDLIVIMAGYPDDMERLMEGNAGLRSRVPYTIVFPNYTRLQLFEIFIRMTDKAFKHTPELDAMARAYFESLPDDFLQQKSFGNARFVRNLFERVWGKAAMRCRSQETEIVIDAEDFEAALAAMDVPCLPDAFKG